VQETGQFVSTGGRKAVKLAPVSNKKTALGLEITKHYISIVLINMIGDILCQDRIYTTFKYGKDYFKSLGDIVDSFIDKNGVFRQDLLGCGISLPASIDHNTNTLIFSHALEIKNIPLETFSRHIGCECLFANDANAAGSIELRDMPAQPLVIYIALNDSVGGSIFIDGKLYEGDHFQGGGFGHTLLHPGKAKCACGKLGCVDAYLSAWVLARETNGVLTDFFERLDKNDAHCKKIWSRYLDDLSKFCGNLCMAFDCPIIIGGYVGGCWPDVYMMPELQTRLARDRVFDFTVNNVRACRFLTKPAAMGAAMLHIDKYIESI
jgi:predicted NBD/HSP70 family sugar kinase